MQIGIDLGATKIESVLLDNNGSELHRSRKESPKNYKETLNSIGGHGGIKSLVCAQIFCELFNNKSSLIIFDGNLSFS